MMQGHTFRAQLTVCYAMRLGAVAVQKYHHSSLHARKVFFHVQHVNLYVVIKPWGLGKVIASTLRHSNCCCPLCILGRECKEREL